MPAPCFGRPHSLPSWLSLLLIPLLWPGLVHASDDFAAPTPRMIDQLRQQHSAEDWLRVTVETNRLELMATTSAESVATEPAPPEAWVTKVRARIKPGDLLRLTGDFGQFSGRAAIIDHQGFSGLAQYSGRIGGDGRPIYRSAFESTVPLPREPLAWTEIDRIDRWGGRSRKFAQNTGLVIGLVGGVLSALAVTTPVFYGPAATTTGEIAGAAVGGFAIGAAAGAVLGALLGAVMPGWNVLHRGKH